ncbi:N-acetylglucosamine-6-phosphate deacetylase [Deinococcus sp. Leaf326]|uniref:N-acetylglucosamine-6-phosphate deacetylase n=1 Tax=Deinococcus sp. Leaf326 TaxID=1736338 RepID=UPI0006FFB8AE|nr:amidohydrolase family protein [Deinococcus sp. Leaf326]KQR00999.1 N-acetylglucosamine-6-phosphate deacetylase [Deinococcus sp. Leaf326]
MPRTDALSPPAPSTTLEGQVLTPEGTFRPGRLQFGTHVGTFEALDEAPDRWIVPGFIDSHVHGGGGGDTMDGPEGVRTLAREHARYGTTTLLPTTITQTWDRVLAALRGVREVMEAGGVPGGANLVGAHLEGPFISMGRLGAQPPHAVDPAPERVAEALATGVVRAVTLAPELPGALEAALAFAAAGVRVGVGHTLADADTVAAFLQAVRGAGGRVAATHLFNAMGGVEGRAPGPAGALMADPEAYLEIILDGHHVHDLAFLLARAAAPGRVVLVSDAMRAAGLGDGYSELGGQPVTVTGGRATLLNGSLAGSVLTLDAALRRAVAAGVPLAESARMLGAVPAASLGLRDRGELRPGLRADVIALSPDLTIERVYVGGQPIPLH